MKRVDKTKSWKLLGRHHHQLRDFNLRAAFAEDPQRVEKFSLAAVDLHFDFSKHLASDKTMRLLLDLAKNRDVASGVRKMFEGKHINVTEDRAVLHTALRRPATDELTVDGQAVVADVHHVLSRMEDFARAVRDRRFLGSTGRAVDTVVNIGIGGSDLGPVMAYEALRAYSDRSLTFRFVSNVDGSDLAEALHGLDPETTLFIVASKTFTTSETMTNAHSAKEWLAARLGADFNPSAHFAALSTNGKLVDDFGVAPANVFGFWDWVGGRFSMDSAIGLSTMIAIGPENFRALLGGFHQMDRYLDEVPAEENAIYWAALLGIWYRDFFRLQASAVLPYEHYLKRFPAYLQQLIMESNGKAVDLKGRPVVVDTSPIYWGEPGTNGQHSFHQLLHQGTTTVPVDFLVGLNPVNQVGHHHELLVSNVLAQASVLAFGRTRAEVLAEGVVPELAPHKVMPGNRPSTLITYDRLTPSVLGQLVAFYEHLTLIQGLIWGIDSFDQWGVELGKVVASSILPALQGSEAANLDASTLATVARYRQAHGG